MKTAFKAFITSALTAAFLSASPALAADNYQIDGVHSSAVFKIKHLNIANVYGRFNDISGSVMVDAANPAKSSVEIVIKTDSVDTNNEKRDAHLKSPDFFNAKQFPTLSFKSTKVEKMSADKYKVSGNLTLHGVTKAISFTFHKTGEGKDPWGNMRMGGEASFTVNRMDYGVKYMPDGLSHDVTIMVAFEGVKQK